MIDTLKASRTLKKNGFDDNQADAIIEIVCAQEHDLATKGDVNLLREHTDAGFGALRREMRAIHWMVGVSIGVSIGILAAFIVSFPR